MGASAPRGSVSVPMRMCRACRIRRPQDSLTRWVIREDRLVQGEGRRLTGRGIYSCSEACAAQLQRGIASIKRKR